MSKLNPQYLFKDKEHHDPSALSDYDTLDFVSNDQHVYGEIMWPDGEYSALRPCVIMLHGFPGSARNDDIAHALCRIGCVVMVPHHRGAWGSEGKYLITHCIEDARNLVDYAKSDAFCRRYNVDARNIVLPGHSMGANTALNAGKSISDIRGLILITPFVPTRYLCEEKRKYLTALLEKGKILQSDGAEYIYQDVEQHRDQMNFEKAFEKIKDQNILCLAGEYDSCAPISEMVQPLWSKLEAHHTQAVQRLKIYPAEHGLLGCRVSAITEIADFLTQICS